jgi:hypothetical protein
MTTIPDNGLDRIATSIADSVSHVAVGSGTNESTSATALGNREFAAARSTATVEILQPGETGEIEAVIAVKGGTEVPGGTGISEVGVFDGDPTAAGATLLFIDEFSTVTVEDGHLEEFTIPIDARRI